MCLNLKHRADAAVRATQWGKAANRFETHGDGSVTVHFDDGSSSEGIVVVACDGGSSRIRRQLLPGQENYQIPVNLIGVKLEVSAEEIEPLRQLDAYFLQGTASKNDSYVYFSSEPLCYSLFLKPSSLSVSSSRRARKRQRAKQEQELQLPGHRLLAG